MGISHSEMDRYLRDRKKSTPSWWTKIFEVKRAPMEDFTEEQTVKLKTMEQEIKRGAEEQAQIKAEEERIDMEQEERVTLYERFFNLFRREQKLDQEYAEVVEMKEQVVDTSVTDDFRKLAQIQVQWLSRLPTRVKEEFKESEDYNVYTEILTRRGVMKRK